MLGPISLLDCIVFVICLAPQLPYQAGIIKTIICIAKVLPFVIFVLPVQLVRGRYLKRTKNKTPFVKSASLFEDVVIRCVRYAFANIDASIGRVFFSKYVAYPFMRFRFLRSLRRPMPFEEIEDPREGLKGLWVKERSYGPPDVLVYYCHGGGFSMGSAYFYLEFLMSLLETLKQAGFRDPAVFALEYSLVPDRRWPTQFKEVRAGYEFCARMVGGDTGRIVVSGDSAGATLVMSRLLHNGTSDEEPFIDAEAKPGLAILLSPWTHLVSEMNRNTPSDYLDRNSLHLYGSQYADNQPTDGDIISPGNSFGRWKEAEPTYGYVFIYGQEEVFAPAIKDVVNNMRKELCNVIVHAEKAGIHAWPVVNLFLASAREKRLKGLKIMSKIIAEKIRGTELSNGTYLSPPGSSYGSPSPPGSPRYR